MRMYGSAACGRGSMSGLGVTGCSDTVFKQGRGYQQRSTTIVLGTFWSECRNLRQRQTDTRITTKSVACCDGKAHVGDDDGVWGAAKSQSCAKVPDNFRA